MKITLRSLQDTGYMRVLGLSASVLAGGYRYNLISLVRGSHTLLQWTESPISIGTLPLWLVAVQYQPWVQYQLLMLDFELW